MTNTHPHAHTHGTSQHRRLHEGRVATHETRQLALRDGAVHAAVDVLLVPVMGTGRDVLRVPMATALRRRAELPIPSKESNMTRRPNTNATRLANLPSQGRPGTSPPRKPRRSLSQLKQDPKSRQGIDQGRGSAICPESIGPTKKPNATASMAHPNHTLAMLAPRCATNPQTCLEDASALDGHRMLPTRFPQASMHPPPLIGLKTHPACPSR